MHLGPGHVLHTNVLLASSSLLLQLHALAAAAPPCVLAPAAFGVLNDLVDGSAHPGLLLTCQDEAVQEHSMQSGPSSVWADRNMIMNLQECHQVRVL